MVSTASKGLQIDPAQRIAHRQSSKQSNQTTTTNATTTESEGAVEATNNNNSKATMGLFTKKKPFPEAAGQKSPEAKASPPSSPERPTETGGAGESVYSDNTKSQKTQQSSDYHPDHDPIDEGNDEEVDEEELHKATEWDEGGKSHCGYSDSVHDTLMAVGGSVHGVVGEPNAHVEKKMNAVANWFQEMSYTIRDLWRGQHDISQDFHDVMNSVMADSGEAHMEDDDDHHKDEPGTSNDVTPNATATTS